MTHGKDLMRTLLLLQRMHSHTTGLAAAVAPRRGQKSRFSGHSGDTLCRPAGGSTEP